MPIAGGLDIHREQITFDYPGTVTGRVRRGQVSPADREHLRAWLARFHGRDDVAFAAGGCTGWRYVAEEVAAAGVAAHLAGPADTAVARGRKRHARTGRTGGRHLRMLLAGGRLPQCRVPPGRILEARALLETYHDLRAGHTARAQLRGAVPARAPRRWARGRCAARRARRRCGLSRPGGCHRPGRAGRSMRPARARARAPAPGYRDYAQVKDRCGGKRAALSEARKILRQACHILAELGDDALAPAA